MSDERDEPVLWTLAEVAGYLDVKEATALQYTRSRGLPLPDAQGLFRADEVRQWQERRPTAGFRTAWRALHHLLGRAGVGGTGIRHKPKLVPKSGKGS